MVKNPLSVYEHSIATGLIQPDDQQRLAINKLNIIFNSLSQSRRNRFFRAFRTSQNAKHLAVKGLYMWGGVGIGKTFLMDLFYNYATFPKLRMHFFTFLHDIHTQLQQHQGQKNPLEMIAKKIALKTKVICFDEFFVTNIADAMILGTLFKALFDEGVVLIATSNTPPDDLYKEGLQRERFLPAIAALKKNCDIIHLTTQHDYRKQQTKPAQVYFYPLDDAAESHMQRAFDFYNDRNEYDRAPVILNAHPLAVIRKHDTILWCDFRDLCEADRSQNDYIALANQFNTILIDGIKPICAKDRKTILRFVHLIDILYDKQVRVIISAATPAQEIYPKGPHAFEFQRSLSRLIEMQSKRYFDRSS